MASSYFFEDLKPETRTEPKIQKLLQVLEDYAEEHKKQVYIIDRPIGEKKYSYSYNKAVVILIPGVKLLFIDVNNNGESFDNFTEDFIEDLGYISDKYEYKGFLGRPRKWEKELVEIPENYEVENVTSIIENNSLSGINVRKAELLISLLTGSINNINRVEGDIPDNALEQIKKDIILFDAEQTRFIFKKLDKKRVTVQGLAGAGKTELLLHKLKDVYINEKDSKIFFTCFNKILARDLKERIPGFFDTMKVEEQIKWNERLWVERSWGSQSDKNTGVYSFICNHYNIPFERYKWGVTFEAVCKRALEKLNQFEEAGEFKPFFDYILIDESQDFSDSFFKLCEKVTKKQVYIAGDIFQNIFDYYDIETENDPDFLLNRVYRTDPKTLMFAHVVGFGLLERPVIRWLSDEEWRACGYTLEKKGCFYDFSREPLKRFTDLENDVSNIELNIAEDDNYLNEVLVAIEDIQTKNPTVKPEDIGVVFLENNDSNYRLAEEIVIKVDEKFGWDAIKGYEVKSKRKDALFISNRNNIKGLEFPFIICITTTPLKTNTLIRNSLYMMLTRSFLTSYLILSEKNGELNKKLKKAAIEIMETGHINVKKPIADDIMDKSELMLRVNQNKSQHEIVEDILETLGIEEPKERKKLHSLVNVMLKNSVDVDKIYTLINNNIGFV